MSIQTRELLANMEQSLTPIFLVTQTFPPRVGGMGNVMYALATGLAAPNHEVHVQGDRAFDAAAENFTFSHNGGFKTFRAWPKKRFLKRIFRPQTGPLVICNSRKSVSAVPDMTHSGGRLAVLAHGQEYLKTGRRAERVARALARTDIFITNSEETLARATSPKVSLPQLIHIIYFCNLSSSSAMWESCSFWPLYDAFFPGWRITRTRIWHLIIGRHSRPVSQLFCSA